jgi:large subunit ribosomal protein L34
MVHPGKIAPPLSRTTHRRRLRIPQVHRCRATRVPQTRRQAVKRTFQPNNRRRAKRHGFRHRMSDRAGKAVVRARRLKGRKRLSA